MAIIKMCNSIEPRDHMYIKDYGFLSLAKSIGKPLSNKYSQRFFDSAEKDTINAIKTPSKRTMQKKSRSNWWFNW